MLITHPPDARYVLPERQPSLDVRVTLLPAAAEGGGPAAGSDSGDSPLPPTVRSVRATWSCDWVPGLPRLTGSVELSPAAGRLPTGGVLMYQASLDDAAKAVAAARGGQGSSSGNLVRCTSPATLQVLVTDSLGRVSSSEVRPVLTRPGQDRPPLESVTWLEHTLLAVRLPDVGRLAFLTLWCAHMALLLVSRGLAPFIIRVHQQARASLPKHVGSSSSSSLLLTPCRFCILRLVMSPLRSLAIIATSFPRVWWQLLALHAYLLPGPWVFARVLSEPAAYSAITMHGLYVLKLGPNSTTLNFYPSADVWLVIGIHLVSTLLPLTFWLSWVASAGWCDDRREPRKQTTPGQTLQLTYMQCCAGFILGFFHFNTMKKLWASYGLAAALLSPAMSPIAPLTIYWLRVLQSRPTQNVHAKR